MLILLLNAVLLLQTAGVSIPFLADTLANVVAVSRVAHATP